MPSPDTFRGARRAAALGALVAATALGAGCAPRYYATNDAYGYPASPQRVERVEYGAAPQRYEQRVERVDYGVVDRIEFSRDGAPPVGVGAVVGGVAGGVIGHQFGSGRGNTAATVAGAIGGAIIGNEIERSQARDRYRIVVRLDNGAMVALDDIGEGQLRPGDRVRIVNNRAYRA
jgi:outer membrane lipoprotein SlyB